jgi:hypothetical protein
VFMLACSREWLIVPVTRQADVTADRIYMAVVDASVSEPATADYKPAFWAGQDLVYPGTLTGPTACYLPDAGEFPAGEYMIFLRLVPGSGGLDIRWSADRLRVGDPRS